MVLGTMVYWIFFGCIYHLSPLFAVAYVLYPLFEAGVLLSAINWAWHAFLDPDTTNNYASSVTIFEGCPLRTNILNEDYHVVHHQYPGMTLIKLNFHKIFYFLLQKIIQILFLSIIC